jgi:GNAT superfamily N-acetyltransferase
MTFKVEKARPEDVPAVIALLYEFAEYESLRDYCEITLEILSDVVFGENRFVRCLVARDPNAIIGYAIYYPNFATFRGQRGLYLEDLYVKEDRRGTGVGDALLRAVAREAKDMGCERIDFQVLEWNQPAIGFYFMLGALRDDEERHFKFVDEAFQRLAT